MKRSVAYSHVKLDKRAPSEHAGLNADHSKSPVPSVRHHVQTRDEHRTAKLDRRRNALIEPTARSVRTVHPWLLGTEQGTMAAHATTIVDLRFASLRIVN